MRRAGRKGGDFTFVFCTPKQSRIKDPAEIERHQLKKSKNLSVPAARTRNTQLSNSNRPKALKASSLSQVLNADSEEDISNSESLLGSKTDLDDINNKDLIASFLATDIEDSFKKAKKDK